MSVLVDTSVWSLALRRDTPPDLPHVRALVDALAGDDQVLTTGLILQELLQGFSGARRSDEIIQRFDALTMVTARRQDYIAAANTHTVCRQHGVQLGTVDCLIAQLAIRHEAMLLSTDRDFTHAAQHVPLKLWPGARRGSRPRAGTAP